MLEQIWQDLANHRDNLEKISMNEEVFKEPTRFSKFSLQVGDLLLDYSKQRITQETLDKLVKFSDSRSLSRTIEALFSGEPLNISEGRPVLHTALRDMSPRPIWVNGKNIKSDIIAARAKMSDFVNAVLAGTWQGISKRPITDVISLGIGGSDLGPVMAVEALKAYHINSLKIHFVSNVDGKTLDRVLTSIDPRSTLCVINSKTFSTLETLENATTVKTWFQNSLGDATQQLVAVTANVDGALAFGILPQNIFAFWDFIGGRYSVWSSVGLPIALKIGVENFEAFLRGAERIDQHFREAPYSQNMPVLLALLGIWNINFWGLTSHAIIPYEDGLLHFPAYLQQLEMESNGKQVSARGARIPYNTAPVLWGGVGCNNQHAYMQLLHQGTQVVPIDFIMGVKAQPGYETQQAVLLASCLSQSKALMEGTHQTSEPVDLAKQCVGSRPSNTLLYPTLTPDVLGSLIALYEHKVFVQGVLWGINSFDQWGVELGKNITKTLLPLLQPNAAIPASLDSSTRGLLRYIHTYQLD